MSHKHYTPHVTGIMHDITVLTDAELIEQYGIEISLDRSVFDPVEDRTFKNLQEWAAFILEQEEDAYDHYEKIGHKHAFDDY